MDLSKTATWVTKAIICFSIYGTDISQEFSKISMPLIRIFSSDKELYRFELSNLSIEKTVIALEIYLYKGEWKLSFVGAGYRSGLEKLCENYGVNVE